MVGAGDWELLETGNRWRLGIELSDDRIRFRSPLLLARARTTWKEGEDKVGIQNKVQGRFIQKKGLQDPSSSIQCMLSRYSEFLVEEDQPLLAYTTRKGPP